MIKLINKYYIILVFALILSPLKISAETTVLVSVAPYEEILKELGGNELNVLLVVPSTASSHSYEPTPQHLRNMSKAKILFTTDEPHEEKIRNALQSQNHDLIIVNLKKGLVLPETHEHSGCTHDNHSHDPHIWMSPKLMKKQVDTIAMALKAMFPDQKEEISQREEQLQKKLTALDLELRLLLATKKGGVVLVSHPAYGYFCNDYHLKELSIEFDGKDPSPKELTSLIQEARRLKIPTIFVQDQYSKKAAELIAQSLNSSVVNLNPYSEHYFKMMHEIGEAFAKGAAIDTEQENHCHD